MNKNQRKVLKKLNRQVFGSPGVEGFLFDAAFYGLKNAVDKNIKSRIVAFEIPDPPETIDVPDTDYKVIE